MRSKKITFDNCIALLIFFVMLFMPVSSLFAQTLTPKEWEAIQKSGNYLIGMGVNASIEEARQTALSDLAGQISTKVSSQFNYELINENKGQKVDSESRMKSVINSYSNVTLKDVAEYVVQDKKGYVVYRYMKVSDMRAMFKRRIGLAKKWANEAIEREKEGKVGDALQDFYWSLALLNSCPDADLETIGYSETSMQQDIHRRVKEILEGVSVVATSVEKEPDHVKSDQTAECNEYKDQNDTLDKLPCSRLPYKHKDRIEQKSYHNDIDSVSDKIPDTAKEERAFIKAVKKLSYKLKYLADERCGRHR